MSELADILDQAIDRIRRGEDLETILADYPPQANNLGSMLAAATALDALQPVPTPAPDILANDRNLFLTELAQLPEPAVSGGPLMRLKEWIAHYSLPKSIQFTIFKEQRRMNTLLIKATLVLVLLLGSAGGAAVASADSLPGGPLYPVKIIVEDAWLALTPDVADQAALHMNLAQVRLREIKQLALGGETVPEATLARFQLHLNQTLHLAAQAPDETMLGLLTRTRQMAQNQEHILTQIQTQVTGPSQESLHQAGIVLKQAGQEAEIGLKEPQTFRYRWQHAEGDNPEPQCDEADCDPQRLQHQNQHQNQNQRPDPPDELCSGEDCPGAPVQNQNQHQNQNQRSDPPDEPCSGEDCPGAPVQNQNQNQNQLSDPPGEPCSGGDCPGEPVQNQNQGIDEEEIRDRERARIQEQSQDGSPAGPDDNGNEGSDNGGNDDNGGNSDNGGNNASPPDNGGSDNSGGNSGSDEGNDNGNGGSDNNSGNSDNGGDSGSDESNDNGNGGGNNGGGNGGGGGGGK